MVESTEAEATVHVGVRMRAGEAAELRAAAELIRRNTGRRVTQSDLVREGALAHVRQLVANEQKAA